MMPGGSIALQFVQSAVRPTELVNAYVAPETLSDASISSPVRVIHGQLTLNKQGNFAAGSNSVVGVRGAITIAHGTTMDTGYVYGVQGKLTIAGTLANESGFNCGVFAQLDMSAITGHTSGYLAPIIADFSTASALATDANADMMVLLNTSQCAINSILKTAAKASYFLDLSDLGQGAYIVATAKGSGWDKSLKIKLNGTDYYIPCNPAAS